MRARERHKLHTRVQVTDGAPQLDSLYCTVSLTFLAHESVLQQWVPYLGHSVLTTWNIFYKLTVPQTFGKPSAFRGTRNFFTMFTRALSSTLS
jgi:hypothetical protein